MKKNLYKPEPEQPAVLLKRLIYFAAPISNGIFITISMPYAWLKIFAAFGVAVAAFHLFLELDVGRAAKSIRQYPLSTLLIFVTIAAIRRSYVTVLVAIGLIVSFAQPAFGKPWIYAAAGVAITQLLAFFGMGFLPVTNWYDLDDHRGK